MRARLAVTAVLLHATLIVPGRTVLAQDDGNWHVSLTPYLWLAGMTGRLGFGGSIADIDLSAGDVLDQSDITLTALLEARRGRWLTRLDLKYLSASQRFEEGGGTGSVLFELEQTMLQPELGYVVIVAPWGGVDALAGGRYWHPQVDVTAEGVGGPIDISSGSRSWFDGTVGVRVRGQPAPKWRLVAKGDLGAGGSQFTWQATGAVGFDLSTCCSAVAAYRHLDVDYDRDAFVADIYLSGFALGLEIRF